MSTITLAPGQMAVLGYGATLADGTTPAVLSSLTATIDSYPDAYVGPGSSGPTVFIVQKVTQPKGTTKTVHVTFNGKSEDGTPLPPVVESVDLQGPPFGPQAANVSLTVNNIRDTIGVNTSDPGSDTITLI